MEQVYINLTQIATNSSLQEFRNKRDKYQHSLFNFDFSVYRVY